MLIIIHLAEILYLSYLGTGSSSKPKLGYQKRYHWNGDEASSQLREPTPWADNNMWMGVGGKGWVAVCNEWVSSGVIVFWVPTGIFVVLMNVFGLNAQLSKKHYSKWAEIGE